MKNMCLLLGMLTYIYIGTIFLKTGDMKFFLIGTMCFYILLINFLNGLED